MKLKHIIKVLIIAIFLILINSNISNASLYLNNLEFDAQINEDGSMDVTETWDIDISETNTLYKTFELDSSKYSGITNVQVTEITNGIEKDFYNTNTWAYHLDKNYYFGGMNDDGKFEIAWGVSLDNSSDTRKYRITYNVTDAIAKYNDCAELYWQFIGEDFEISAEKVSGIIRLPQRADSLDDIKVWGHIETLNEEIYVADNNIVTFEVDEYSSGRYLEVRIAMPTDMIGSVRRTYNKDALPSIIAEETEWAEAANRLRRTNKIIEITFICLAVIVVLILSIVMIKKMRKYLDELSKMNKKYKPTQELDYFREIPDETASPAEALFLNLGGVNTSSTNIGNIFSATMLDLNLKGCIEINVDKNKKGKDGITIKLLKEEDDALQENEKVLFNFLVKMMNNHKEITIKELQKKISSSTSSVSAMMKKLPIEVNKIQEEKENYSKEEKKKFDKYLTLVILYLVFGIGIIPFLPVSILMLVNGLWCFKIMRRCNVLTQKGVDESEKWKGLKKYMLDFSMLNEKEVPSIVIWEKYLVFATAFGIADKVLKQLKLVYPEIENIDAFNTASCIYIMSSTDFSSSFTSAINSSFSSAMSSGSGRRWRFLRRRRRPADGGGGRWTEDSKKCGVILNFPIKCWGGPLSPPETSKKFLKKGISRNNKKILRFFIK